MHAFFLDSSFWHTQTLKDTEYTHATKVLRMKKGEHFLLYNGKGIEAECEVAHIDKKHLTFQIIAEKHLPAPSSRVILAAAWTKAARRGFLLEKAVELEASALWIWKAEYSQFPLPDTHSATVESWQAQLIAGVKQCRNPFLPDLQLFSSQNELIHHAQYCEYKHVLTTDPSPNIKPYTSEHFSQQGTTIVVIGTEGGFAPSEIDMFHDHDYQFFTMGDRILRYETAAVLALGLHFWHHNTVI